MANQTIIDALWVDDGDYFFMRDGRIYKKNFNHTKKTREVKQRINTSGYLVFKYNGKWVSSHRKIASLFITNPDNLPQINHKSEKFGTVTDNVPTNLEWCTPAYNQSYGTRIERVREKTTNGKLSRAVYQYALDGTFLREWPSMSEVQRELGFFVGSISACCRGRTKTAYGYIWSYEKKA